MPIRETLQHAPVDRPVAVLLRHAERFAIETPDDGWNARLTPAGHVQAEELGAALQGHTMTCKSSPIPRCLQTAENLRRGALAAGAQIGDVAELRELAGPYLTDATSVMQVCLAIGDRAFVRQWFDESLEMAGLMRARTAALGQLQVLVETLASAPPEPALHLHFSHDWNILLIRERFLGITHEDRGMPPFLDGLIAYRDGQELVVRYRDVERSQRWRRLAEPA